MARSTTDLHGGALLLQVFISIYNLLWCAWLLAANWWQQPAKVQEHSYSADSGQ
jgi:hypothetical protein